MPVQRQEPRTRAPGKRRASSSDHVAPAPARRTKLPASRAEARAQGLKLFDTGVPCRHGHVSHRYTSNHECVECNRLRQVNRTYEQHERHNEALAQGLNRYATGAAPCRHGHTGPRYTRGNQCVECVWLRSANIRAARASEDQAAGDARREKARAIYREHRAAQSPAERDAFNVRHRDRQRAAKFDGRYDPDDWSEGVFDRPLVSFGVAKVLKSVTRYFTGKPCKYDHVVERHFPSGACTTCRRIKAHKANMLRNGVYKRLALSPINAILRDDVVAARMPGQETDHVRPLFGRFVWGFDADYNLENIDAKINSAKSNKDPTDAQTLEAARATLAPLPTLNMWLQGLSGVLAETERTKARNARNAQHMKTSQKAQGSPRPCTKCKTPAVIKTS